MEVFKTPASSMQYLALSIEDVTIHLAEQEK
jgi:hypothetical protein